MQKHTRSRPTSRSASVEAHETGAPLGCPPSPSPPRRHSQYHVPVPSPLAAGVATSSGRQSRQTTSPAVASLLPEPVRRWHSFHSRRSSVQQAPGVVEKRQQPQSQQQPQPPASRFLSPPPLTPRRRFSVW